MPSKHSEITFAKYGLGVYRCKGMKIELDRLKVHGPSVKSCHPRENVRRALHTFNGLARSNLSENRRS